MRTIRIGDRFVGDGHPALVCFEAGATHDGLTTALRLCDAAREAGADAVKFQTIRAADLLVSRDTTIEFMTSRGPRSESVYTALERRELSFDDWRKLKRHCDDLGLLFISTPSGPETLDLLAEIGADAVKISKSDVTHRLLIRQAAGTGIPLIIDGRERFEDVAHAVDICEQAGLRDIVIMHCPSGYPAEHGGVHLSAIRHIREIFGYPVGYADHSTGTVMNFAALALGADMLEKTITLDRETNAVEHAMSLEPHELASFVTQVRAVEAALGNPRIIFSSRVNAEHRRSVIMRRTVDKGQVIVLDDIDFRRPGTHIPAERYDAVVGRRAAGRLAAGTFPAPSDLDPP